MLVILTSRLRKLLPWISLQFSVELLKSVRFSPHFCAIHTHKYSLEQHFSGAVPGARA